jgi:hypothetical protein
MVKGESKAQTCAIACYRSNLETRVPWMVGALERNSPSVSGRSESYRAKLKVTLESWCREGELNPQGAKHRRIFEGMKSIPLQYRQLLVSASDAGPNKIELRSNSGAYHSLRRSPVTTASRSLRLQGVWFSNDSTGLYPRAELFAENQSRYL